MVCLRQSSTNFIWSIQALFGLIVTSLDYDFLWFNFYFDFVAKTRKISLIISSLATYIFP